MHPPIHTDRRSENSTTPCSAAARRQLTSVRQLAVAAATLLCLVAPAAAQSLLPGDLLVSRTTYEGVTGSVTVGAALPGGGVAVNDGSSLSIFNNETPDPSFGITAPIMIDQFNTGTSTVDNTINVTALAAAQSVNLTTSFPSKSEIALNFSTDGSAVTFMGYVAPQNTLDVSNANTTAAFDATNPVSSTYQRGIATLNLNGTLTVTPTNAYSGNNGRAAVLDSTSGNYFTVGNAGNSGKAASEKNSVIATGNTTVTVASTASIVAGEAVTGTGIPTNTTVASVTDATHLVLSAAPTTSATETLTVGTSPSGTLLSTLSNNTGVQSIAVGSSGNTTVIGAPNGTSGSSTGYQNGFAIQNVNSNAPDKTGKDDNFRGLTVFNNTLYVTKGSGSNGVNTVYQVGATGSLPTLAANASTTQFSILSGFSTTLASGTTGVANPFGLFFANANTLYVADEGNGSDATSTFAGLEKWTFSGGSWHLAYTLTNGLGIGQAYTVSGQLANGTTGSITTHTDGLRNLAGKVNGDGTVTLYAITSTFGSSVVDSGADPNKLVTITDSLASADGSGETFSTLETAAYGDALRGVALTPVPEPSTYAALAGVAALGLALIRRRRKAA